MAKTLALAALVGALGVLLLAQPGAKEMFYNPGGGPTRGGTGSSATAPQLRPIAYARPFPPYGNVGVHFWFQEREGRLVDERGAAESDGELALNVRSNVAGFVTVWSLTRGGAELSPRTDSRWPGRLLDTETLVVSDVRPRQAAGEATRLILVFGRSQSEQAGSAEHAERRLRDLTSRVGRDGFPQITRESDVSTPGELGDYVVNREGMPLAVEIVLQAR